jgi:hypothetical protein
VAGAQHDLGSAKELTMSAENGKNGAHDQTVNGGDILGGPDPAGPEDIMGPPGDA